MSSHTRIPSKKSRDEIDGDRISNLPESVLSCIFSSLTIEDAVRTSVLSRNWEYKWTLICDIVICDDKDSTNASFVKFVERLLLLTEDVKSFYLHCNKDHGANRMTTWICSLLKRNLRSLTVYSREAGIIMPRKLLSCYFLEYLKLMLPCTFKVPERVCFGSLTTLYLEDVTILNEASTADPVLFDFPVLETCTLIKCEWLNVKWVEIYAPKMFTFVCETPYNTAINDYSIKIIGDSLQRFRSYGELPEKIVLSGGEAVVYAQIANNGEEDDIHLLGKSGLQARKLLKQFLKLECLKLSYYMTCAIALSRRYSLPTFCNLEKLHMGGNAGALVELLHAAPSLKRLTMYTMDLADYNYDDEHVPSCIKSHLEEVKLELFSGSTPDFKLVKYLLENAVKLKKFFLSNEDGYLIPKNDIAKELSTCSTASTCLIVFFM